MTCSGEKKFNPEARAKDIATLKTHCSLLRGLPDRVVAELYEKWGRGFIISWPEPEAPFEVWGLLTDRTNVEAFTDHVVWLWSGEAS